MTNNQDFNQRLAIVVDHNLPGWQTMNATAHIAAYLGNKMPGAFDTGDYFTDKSGEKYPRNSQYPIIVFQATGAELKNLITAVRSSGLLHIGFIEEMIEFTDDDKLQEVVGQKNSEEINYLGIGFFGPNDVVKGLTKKFSLWK